MNVIVKQIALDELPAKGKCLQYAFISDIHLGHPRTPTYKIINSLYDLVFNGPMMATLDALFICGDLFDSLITLPGVGTSEINSFCNTMLRMSVRYNVPIRIIYGTPSHDWDQSKIIIDMNVDNDIGADVQYISTLDIIDDKSLNMTIGYVPDEYGNGCESTLVEFKELMAIRGYDKLQLIIMHGQFFFQVPEMGRNLKTQFDDSHWSPLANLIVIGHDHRFKYLNNIVVPSSIERLAQGEEEAKGFLIAHIGKKDIAVYHIENKNAMMYKTVGCALQSDTEIVQQVESIMAGFNGNVEPIGRILIKHSIDYDFTALVKEWNTLYPNVHVSSKPDVVKKKVELLADDSVWSTAMIPVTADNIVDVIKEYDETSTADIEDEIRHIMAMM